MKTTKTQELEESKSKGKSDSMKAYIVEYGEVVSTAKFVGKFDDMYSAQTALIGMMDDGDEIALFPDDAEPLYTDNWGYVTVDTEEAEEVSVLWRDDGTLDYDYGAELPEAGSFYYFDDDLETVYVYKNGKWVEW